MKPIFPFMRGLVARRILGLFLLCALLPIGTLAFFSLQEMSRNLKGQTEQRLRHASKNIGVGIMDGFAFLRTEMEAMALPYTIGIRKSIGKMTDAYGKDQHSRFLGLTHFRGRFRADTLFGVPCPPPPLTETARKHLASGQAIVFVQRIGEAPSRVFIALGTDLKSPENGLLVGEIGQEYLKNLIENALPVEGDVILLDSNGDTVYSSRPLPMEVTRKVIDGSKRAVSGQMEWTLGDDTYLINYRSIFLKINFLSEDWIVIVSQSKADAFAPLKTFTRTFGLIVVLTILVVSLLGIGQIRKSLVPLEKLREGTKKISGGDFEGRIDIASGDEFEDLARSFNTMSDRLGRQFNALTGMGRMVRMILSALDRERIVEVVLANIRSVIRCDCVSIALVEPGTTDAARIFSYGNGNGNPAEMEETPIAFTSRELEKLQAAESLTVEAGTEFQSLLFSMAKQGAFTFFLLPVFLQQRLCGVLVLGYLQPPEQPREDLLHGRQIVDQITVALMNAGLLEELSELNWGTLTALARATDANSHWTAGHSERVTALAMAIGREMELEARELDSLHRAGLLHDIGKIAVPGFVLDKPGKLTPEEYLLVKEHPGKGALILEPIPAYKEIIPMVAQHHEWFNGQGYPQGLAGNSICLGARILAVADVYDALISDRPYRPGLEPARVFAHIEENTGRQFDPEVFEAFRKVVPREAALQG